MNRPADDRWRSAAETVRAVASRAGRRQRGVFAIEGTRLLERALAAGADVRQVLTTDAALKRADSQLAHALQRARAAGADVVTMPAQVMATLTDGRTFGQAIALVQALPQTAWSTVTGNPSRLLLVAVDITDPGNAGALARTALASGATALIAVGETDPFHPKATRTSMGAVLKLPSLICSDAATVIDQLGSNKVRMIAAATDGRDITDTDDAASPDCSHALFVGSEAHGLPESVLRRMDQRWRVPMSCKADSYSVNAAAAICLYELQRRHRRHAASSDVEGI